MALGVPDIPQSGGMKTQALIVISLADLIQMDGGSDLAAAWLDAQDEKIRTATLTAHSGDARLTARAGEPGWLSAVGAAAAACAAEITPVVTGTPDWDVIGEMADVFLDAHGIHGPLSREARLALERTLLAMAIKALSGPGGLAGFLRANLLGRPFSGVSLPLDLGNTDHIPDYLRRAVILRDRHCQWPGGCDQPASRCEPHHRRPRAEGGETSLENIDLYCLTHHHIFIHRLGWKVITHPDGTRTAISPQGKTIHSHCASGERGTGNRGSAGPPDADTG
jgi:hypothetical protein